MNYIKPTAVDSATVGNLYSARDLKKRQWQLVKRLRQAIQDEPLGGNRMGLRLQLLHAESNWRETILTEQQCLRAIEARANELGMTTIRSKAA